VWCGGQPDEGHPPGHAGDLVFQHRLLDDLAVVAEQVVDVLLGHVFREVRYVEVGGFHVGARGARVRHFQPFVPANETLLSQWGR
jgi:hypothetical protein